jgi:hypothetical protein
VAVESGAVRFWVRCPVPFLAARGTQHAPCPCGRAGTWNSSRAYVGH